MIYQQELKEIESFYEKYREKKIVYSKEVTQQINLIQKDTAIKVGDLIIKGALISSTMDSFVILARLDEIAKRMIFDLNGTLSVHLKFVIRETGKSILFTIHTKFLNMNNQGLAQKNLQFISMQIRRKIPNDLIRIFGLYHEEEKERRKNKKKKVECLLLSSESKVDCLTDRISKSELVLTVENPNSININQKAIAILKIVNTGEVIEIIGTVIRKTEEADNRCRIFLQYTMDDQSPRFGYSVHVLRNLINP